MSAVSFAPRPERSLFIASRDVHGKPSILSVHVEHDRAARVAVEAGGEVREVPFNVGNPGQALWGWSNVYKRRMGKLEPWVAEATGVEYGDFADVPRLQLDEWAEYKELAATAGRNPLGEKFEAARIEMMKSAASLSAPVKKLYAVATEDERGAGQPFLVAVLDVSELVEAKALLALAAAGEPELEGHFIVELYTEVENSLKWGAKFPAPTLDEVTAELLGEHADGTVFFTPGTVDEYTLSGGKLREAGGFEVDVLGLALAGLRVRTAVDVQDIAYTKMQGMLADAPTRTA